MFFDQNKDTLFFYLFSISTTFDITSQWRSRHGQIYWAGKLALRQHGIHNVDITRFIAKESRSFVASVCCVMRRGDFPSETLHLDKILANAPAILLTGGTCLAAPDGEWLIEPLGTTEKLVVAEINHQRVREERQNLDVTGHYSRPDVLQLKVNRERQSILKLVDFP